MGHGAAVAQPRSKQLAMVRGNWERWPGTARASRLAFGCELRKPKRGTSHGGQDYLMGICRLPP